MALQSRTLALAPERAELNPVAPGAWCVCDTAIPRHDARRVIAYLEQGDDRVDVVWVRDPGRTECFASLGEAFDAIGEVLQCSVSEF
jgi:hypothetical protein